MVGSQYLFADRQRPLVERLRIGVATLVIVKQRQVVQRHGHIRIVRAARLFVDCQRTLVERFGVSITALVVVKRSQTDHRCGDIGLVGAKRLFSDRQRALSEWYRIRVFTLSRKLFHLCLQRCCLVTSCRGRHNCRSHTEHECYNGDPAHSIDCHDYPLQCAAEPSNIINSTSPQHGMTTVRFVTAYCADTPLKKSCVVHHSKIGRPMSQLGQNRWLPHSNIGVCFDLQQRTLSHRFQRSSLVP